MRNIYTELFKRGKYDHLDLYPKQVQALRHLVQKENPETGLYECSYGGAKGGGKSHLGCALLVLHATSYPKTAYFAARKELVDIKKSTVISFNIILDKYGFKRGVDYEFKADVSNMKFKFANESEIIFLYAKYLPSDEMYQRFGSLQFTGGWIEESAEVDELAYDNLALTIGRLKNAEYGINPFLLLTCNPNKNWMYHRHYKPFVENKLHKDKLFVQAFAEDNKANSESYMNNLKGIKNKVMYERLYLGEWEYSDSDNQLIKQNCIHNIFTNTFVEAGKPVLSADIALKSDFTCIGTFEGNILTSLKLFNKNSDLINSDIPIAELIENEIKETAYEFKIPNSNIIYDSQGIGQYLDEKIQGAKSYFSKENKAALKELGIDLGHFDDLNSFLAFDLAEAINSNNFYIELPKSELNKMYGDVTLRDMIIEQLQLLRWDNSKSDNKMRIENKEMMKKRYGGKSPDILDMLIMSRFFNVANNQLNILIDKIL